jgi:NADH-quinone oxidoreductase subunit H
VVVSSIAVTLFLGGWLRPFPNVRVLNFLDYIPIVAMLGIGAICFLGAAREQRRIEQVGMAGLGIACLLLGGLFCIPVVLSHIGGFFWFALKVALIIYGFIWIRFTFPRYRYDQLMNFGWRWLMPLAILNIVATSLWLALR